METMVLNNKTYYRATKKGYEAAMEFYKIQEMDVFVNFFKKAKEQETKLKLLLDKLEENILPNPVTLLL